MGFALYKSWQYRKVLQAYLFDSNKQVDSLEAYTVEQLVADDIQALVLDFDGVLASHGEDKPDQAIEKWLKIMLLAWPNRPVFVLTNRPNQMRQCYFRQQFPSIEFILSKKKPYPDGLLAIIQKTHLPPKQILLFDDRLMTGVLAGILAGIQVKWITKPKTNLKKRPISESFFKILRSAEKRLLGFLPRKIQGRK